MFKLDPTWVMAIAAVVYAFFTGWIIYEMRKDRKLHFKPVIKAILKNANFPRQIWFSFKNIGRGPAIINEIECKSDSELEWVHERGMLPIGADETMDLKFEVVEDTAKWGDKIFLTILFQDIFGKTYRETLLTLTPKYLIDNFPVA